MDNQSESQPSSLVPTNGFESFCDQISSLLLQPKYYIPLVCLFTFCYLLSVQIADPDLFARIAMGRLVEASGSVPNVDPFAFTEKKAQWIDHEWLSGVVFYHTSQLGGDAALYLFKLLMTFASIFLLALAQGEISKNRKYSFLIIAFAGIQSAYVWASTVRSQVFTYLFIPYLLLALVRYQKRADRKLLYLLPLIFCIWANAHGGFVVGLGLLGVFTVGTLIEQRKLPVFLFSMLLLSVLATLINPYGLTYWEYILDAVFMARPSINEWAPISILSFEALNLNFFVLILLIGIYLKKDSRNLTAYALIAVAALYGYKHARLVAIPMMVGAVYGSEYIYSCFDLLSSKLPLFFSKLRRAGALLILLVMPAALWLLISFIIRIPRFNLDYSAYPVSAVQWLKETKQTGNLLINFNQGSYALWRLYPNIKISLDGRYEEVYPNSTLSTVVSALDPKARDHLEALKEINPDFILTDIDKAELFESPWAITYKDNAYSVLARKDSLDLRQAHQENLHYKSVETWRPAF